MVAQPAVNETNVVADPGDAGTMISDDWYAQRVVEQKFSKKRQSYASWCSL